MSPAPETISVAPRALATFGYACGALGVLLGLFLYGLAVARTAPVPACQTPAALPSGPLALRAVR